MQRFLPRVLLTALATLLAPGLAAGARAVPAETEKLIDILFKRPEVESCSLSPSGRYLAFLREDGGRKVLATIELESRDRYATACAKNEDVVEFHWCVSDTLVYKVSRDRNYYSGVWLSDARLGQRRRLGPAESVLEIGEACPTQVLLLDRERLGSLFPDLYRVNSRTGDVDRVEKNPGDITRWFPDNTGAIRFAVRAPTEDAHEALYREQDDAPWAVTPLPPRATPLAFDREGRHVLMQYQGPGGLSRVRAFEVEGMQGVGTELANPGYDILPEVWRDPKTFMPIALCYQTGRPQVEWIDPSYARLNAVLGSSFPGCVIRPQGTTYDGNVLFTAFSDVRPLSFYLLNGKTGEIGLYLPSRPEARGRTWAPMREVSFAARDGYTLRGYLTLPVGRRDGKRVPLIALSHGGPMSRDTWGFDCEVQYFAALGYAVLQVNYRGSTGLGAAHQLSDILQVCHRSVDDVSDGIAWAASAGYADPRRVVAMGGSFGAYISLGIATRYPGQIAAAIGFAGVYDYEQHLRDSSGRHTGLYEWMGRYFPDVAAHAAEYREVSPVHLADRVRAPVLLLHGGADHTVDISQSNLMRDALLAAGRPVEMVSDVASVHGLQDQKSRLEFYRRVTAFLLQNAAPDRAP